MKMKEFAPRGGAHLLDPPLVNHPDKNIEGTKQCTTMKDVSFKNIKTHSLQHLGHK